MRYRIAILIVFFTLMMSVGQCAHGDDKFSFSWGFFLKSADGLVRSLDFVGQEPVVGGDLLRVYLQLQEGSYVYIFLYDSREDLYQVFPPSPDFYKYSYPAWHKYYIPSAREWFTLDESSGVERFFVLASDKRLEDVEEVARQAIFDQSGELAVKQAVEMIEKKTIELSNPKLVSVDPVQVSYTAKLRPLGFDDIVSANRTTVSGPYGLILELINQ